MTRQSLIPYTSGWELLSSGETVQHDLPWKCLRTLYDSILNISQLEDQGYDREAFLNVEQFLETRARAFNLIISRFPNTAFLNCISNPNYPRPCYQNQSSSFAPMGHKYEYDHRLATDHKKCILDNIKIGLVGSERWGIRNMHRCFCKRRRINGDFTPDELHCMLIRMVEDCNISNAIDSHPFNLSLSDGCPMIKTLEVAGEFAVQVHGAMMSLDAYIDYR